MEGKRMLRSTPSTCGGKIEKIIGFTISRMWLPNWNFNLPFTFQQASYPALNITFIYPYLEENTCFGFSNNSHSGFFKPLTDLGQKRTKICRKHLSDELIWFDHDGLFWLFYGSITIKFVSILFRFKFQICSANEQNKIEAVRKLYSVLLIIISYFFIIVLLDALIILE